MGWVRITGQGPQMKVKALRQPRKKKSISVKKLAKKVKKLETDREYFTHDTTFSGSISSTGSFNLINGVAQGDLVNNREGNKINIKSIDMKGFTTLGDTVNLVRTVIFVDTQPNLAAPALGDVLQNVSNPVISNMNLVNRKRFRILYDQVTTLTSDQPLVSFPRFYKKMSLPVNYIDGGATIASINKNSLYVLLVSDSSVATHPGCDFTTRIRYVD